MKMQLNRLQCDNSSLVKTSEILSKQLCIQSKRNINVRNQMKDITEDNSVKASSDNGSKHKKKKKSKGKSPTSKATEVNESTSKEDAPNSQHKQMAM